MSILHESWESDAFHADLARVDYTNAASMLVEAATEADVSSREALNTRADEAVTLRILEVTEGYWDESVRNSFLDAMTGGSTDTRALADDFLASQLDRLQPLMPTQRRPSTFGMSLSEWRVISAFSGYTRQKHLPGMSLQEIRDSKLGREYALSGQSVDGFLISAVSKLIDADMNAST